MAFTAIKPEVYAKTALAILERIIKIPSMVDVRNGAEFKGAKDDTVNIKIAARGTARRKLLRATGNDRIIQTDDLAESKISIKLTDHVYFATDTTDENYSLDISDFAQQVLVPSVRAVAVELEDIVYEQIQSATYVPGLNVIEWAAADDVWGKLVDARQVLNRAFVPDTGRFLLVGSAAEARILKDTDIKPGPNPTGLGSGTLASAALGTIAGWTIVPSSLVGDDEAYGFIKSAFVLANIAPPLPDGASFARSMGSDGFELRWLKDYDSTILSDRSIVDAWVGTASVEDGKVPASAGGVGHVTGSAYNPRAVKFVLS